MKRIDEYMPKYKFCRDAKDICAAIKKKTAKKSFEP